MFCLSFFFFFIHKGGFNFMAALEKEYDFDEFETYVKEKEKVNMNYRKSLVEKSKLPKWLATWYYIGYETVYDYKIEFESNGTLDFKIGTIREPRLSNKNNLKRNAIFYSNISKDCLVKNIILKKRLKECDYEGSSIKDYFGKKHFDRWIKKAHKNGIMVRGELFSPFPNDGKKQQETVGLWWSEDIYEYLIFKLTVTALSIKKYGLGLHSGIVVHDMWKTRNALIKLKNLEDDDYKTVVKEMMKLYNINTREISITFVDEQRFLEYGEIISDLPLKASCLRYDYNQLAKAFNMPISTKEERALFLEKVKKFHDDETRITMDLNNSFEERRNNLWSYISDKLAHLNEWYD